MAQIKHIAIRTRDVDQTAAFYKDAFGLTQVGMGKNGVYLTDGHLNIAILKYQQGKDGEPLRLGVDHVGFQVVALLEYAAGASSTQPTHGHLGSRMITGIGRSVRSW